MQRVRPTFFDLKSILASTSQARYTSYMRRLPSLDGIRAFSLGLVVLGHLYAFLNPNESKTLFWAIVANHSLGVSIFFVVSGFLITLILQEEWHRTGSVSLASFYLRRAFRIWPAFYFFLACLWSLRAMGIVAIPNTELSFAALFLWNYLPQGSSWWLSHTWSLAVEEQFYLLWPLALVFGGLRFCAKAVVVVIALSPLLRVGTFYAIPSLRPHLDWLGHCRMDSLMAGCGLALLWQTDWLKAQLSKNASPWVVAVAAVYVFLGSPLLESVWGSYYRQTLGLTLESLSLAAIVGWLVFNPKTWIGTILNSRVAIYAGALSYSAYLWQQMFLNPYHTFQWHWTANLLAVYLFSELSYRGIEKPFLKFRIRFLNATARFHRNRGYSHLRHSN